MKNFAKKLPLYILTCLLFFAALLVPLGGGKASAAGNEVKFDKTDVLDDLQSIDGFSLANYPYYESAKPEIRVIDFVEYCYDYHANMRNNYGLYLYVYNPNGQNIVVNSTKNKIQLAVAYDSYPITESSNAIDYEKFDLQFCSMSEGAGINKLFYKFKVIDHESADGKTIAERVNSVNRRYDISGIELLTEGNPNATEYGVATSYHFTGFAEGYGENGQGTTLTRNSLETVSLELHSTTYRFPYINQNGPGHQNQLDSVYFAVPKEFNNNYGELYRVKCCWDEQRTAPIIVTNRQDVYDDVATHLGTNGSNAKYGIYDNYSTERVMGAGTLRYADWAFNKNVGGSSMPVITPDTPYVGYIFKSDKSNIRDTEITSAQMKDWIAKHENANYLFTETVDDGRTKGYQEHIFTADEPFDMLTFNQTASGWDKFCLNWEAFWTGKSWDFGPEQQAPVEPIRLIKDGDFTGEDTANAEKLYVHSEDFDEFENFYNANKSTKNVFLLRFAVTDYYSNLASIWDGGFFSSTDDKSAYIAQETVFLDFDIIELTFLRDTTETIIPVVASPIDAVGGISSPISKDSFGLSDWTLWLIVAVLGILLIIVLILFFPILKPLLTVLLKIIWWIITAPFRLIAWIIKKISEAVNNRKEEKTAAPPNTKPTEKSGAKSAKSKKVNHGK